jgi:hypothetical protein
VKEAEEAVAVEMRDRRVRSHKRHRSVVFVGRRDGRLVEETVVSPSRHLDVRVER